VPEAAMQHILRHTNTFTIVYNKGVDARPVGLWSAEGAMPQRSPQ
jgi:hypothetical protein